MAKTETTSPATIAKQKERLTQALGRMKDSSQAIGEVEREIADYCRLRHLQGALAESVLVEVKTLAKPLLGTDNPHLEDLISNCIRHFYGEEKQRPA